MSHETILFESRIDISAALVRAVSYVTYRDVRDAI